jgi:hypothetical protein
MKALCDKELPYTNSAKGTGRQKQCSFADGIQPSALDFIRYDSRWQKY